MGFSVIGDLVAHASREYEFTTILEFGMKFALCAQKYMAFHTPMISEIARRILNHANTNVAKVTGPPTGEAAFTLVLGMLNRRPVGGAERYVGHLHGHSPNETARGLASAPHRRR
jgi:hypothetical protein